MTLVGWNIITTAAKRHWVTFDRMIDGVPLVLVEDGHILKDRLDEARIREEEIMSAARASQIERFDRIKYAILERRGNITVIAKGSWPGNRATTTGDLFPLDGWLTAREYVRCSGSLRSRSS